MYVTKDSPLHWNLKWKFDSLKKQIFEWHNSFFLLYSITVSTAITGDLSISVFTVHHHLSTAGCACLVGRARRRSQCSRAQFCCKDLLMFCCNISFHFHLDDFDSVTGGSGRWAVFYKCIRALSLISKMCVSRSYWCLIPTRMWWRLEASNTTLC